MQNTDNTDNDLLHTGIVFLEDLDRTFLGDLADALHELFTFHGIDLAHTGKMFRCKCRNTLKSKSVFSADDGIANRKDARVKYTDDIPGICLIHDLSFLRHQLLRLRKFHRLISLHMKDFHTGIKLAGADTHKGDPIAVCLVHICLNLEDKCGKIR